MDESLKNLIILNKSLISKNEELRKNLYEKCINFYLNKGIFVEESCFFQNVSMRVKDKEFENLRIKYEKLKDLIRTIDNIEKEF